VAPEDTLRSGVDALVLRRREVTAASPRARVQKAIRHQEPDRAPVDFLAVPEVWRALAERLGIGTTRPGDDEFVDPTWEKVLTHLQVDCRTLSYDMFCNPPESVSGAGGVVDWWGSSSRSTPSRMWRWRLPDGALRDVWGAHLQEVRHGFGTYEEVAGCPLAGPVSLADLQAYHWPQPDWWDWSRLPALIAQLNSGVEHSLRLRIGSVFETAWRLRGMQEFMVDLATDPAVPQYMMSRITEVILEITRRALELAGPQIDMLYYYDDVASQNSLLLSRSMWRKYIRPYHAQLVEMARAHDKPVMYHCDGAVGSLIPDLIDLGIDVLNPIQPGVAGMDLADLKHQYGARLAFHGGVDIIGTLRGADASNVMDEVRDRVRLLGQAGGYILCSSHHIQADTPVANILAMYEPHLRYRLDGSW